MQVYQKKTFVLKTFSMSEYSVSHPEGGNLVISKFLAELGFLGSTNVQKEYCQLAGFSNVRNGERPRVACICATWQY